MRRLFVTLLLCLTLTTTAAAAPSASHIAAAEAMLEVAGTQQTLADAITMSLNTQLDANPALRPYEGVMREFMDRYMSWEAMRGPLALMYAEAFTEKELKKITAFYRTPAGAKAAQLTPELMARGGQLGQQQVMMHQAELIEMIQRRAIELEQIPGATP